MTAHALTDAECADLRKELRGHHAHLFVVAALDELTRLREMDDARVAGLDAFMRGEAAEKNPWPHFGPDDHRGDAWDTGWYLGAGNKARARVTELEYALVDVKEHAQMPSCECIDIPREDCCTCGCYEYQQALSHVDIVLGGVR